jgi:hypothetical protein
MHPLSPLPGSPCRIIHDIFPGVKNIVKFRVESIFATTDKRDILPHPMEDISYGGIPCIICHDIY